MLTVPMIAPTIRPMTTFLDKLCSRDQLPARLAALGRPMVFTCKEAE